MGQLFLQFLREKYSDLAELELYGAKELKPFDQGWVKGRWNLVNDIVKLCDTLDKFREPTEAEKIMLAMKRNPQEPSQAEIMGSGVANQIKEREV